MVPGLAPFGAPHCRPRIPAIQPPGPGQPIFPHGSIDQFRLMRPGVPTGHPGMGSHGMGDTPLPCSSPLPLPPSTPTAVMHPNQNPGDQNPGINPPNQGNPAQTGSGQSVAPGGQPTQTGNNSTTPEINTNNASNNENPQQQEGSFNVIQKIKESMQEEAKRFNSETQLETDGNESKRDFY
jgi:hypothetical protein